MRNLYLVLGLALLASPAAGQAPDLPFKLNSGTKARSFADVAEYRAEIEPKQARPGETVTFKLTVSPKGAAWTYPARAPGQLSTCLLYTSDAADEL